MPGRNVCAMPKSTPATGTPELRLNLDNWYRECKTLGLSSETALAAALNVSTVQLWRVQRGKNSPGNQFIAGMVRVFGWDKLPTLLIEDAAPTEAAA